MDDYSKSIDEHVSYINSLYSSHQEINSQIQERYQCIKTCHSMIKEDMAYVKSQIIEIIGGETERGD